MPFQGPSPCSGPENHPQIITDYAGTPAAAAFLAGSRRRRCSAARSRQKCRLRPCHASRNGRGMPGAAWRMETILPPRIPLLGGTTLTASGVPAGLGAATGAGDGSLLFQSAQDRSDPVAADARAGGVCLPRRREGGVGEGGGFDAGSEAAAPKGEGLEIAHERDLGAFGDLVFHAKGPVAGVDQEAP